MERIISSNKSVIRQTIGQEQCPVLIYDDFDPDPNALRNIAIESFFINGGEVYPGIRAALPETYFDTLRKKLVPEIETAFAGKLLDGFENCTFSIVTTPQNKLKLNQCVPHTDENDENYLAFIHYLCDEELGGTNFFRHKSSSYERITQDRAERYNAAMGESLTQKLKTSYAPQYFDKDDTLFECIYSAENRFNRLVVYSGANLHSGYIPYPERLTEDPTLGRLTITGFMPLTPNSST